jgi:hypothetical protein
VKRGIVTKKSVSWVRERTIPTERPPLVGEVSANFYGQRVPCGQRDGSLRPFSRISRTESGLIPQNKHLKFKFILIITFCSFGMDYSSCRVERNWVISLWTILISRNIEILMFLNLAVTNGLYVVLFNHEHQHLDSGSWTPHASRSSWRSEAFEFKPNIQAFFLF